MSTAAPPPALRRVASPCPASQTTTAHAPGGQPGRGGTTPSDTTSATANGTHNQGRTNTLGNSTTATVQAAATRAIVTGVAGQYVSREETVRGFKEIVEGKHDDKPEQAFYMKGTIDQVG